MYQQTRVNIIYIGRPNKGDKKWDVRKNVLSVFFHNPTFLNFCILTLVRGNKGMETINIFAKYVGMNIYKKKLQTLTSLGFKKIPIKRPFQSKFFLWVVASIWSFSLKNYLG